MSEPSTCRRWAVTGATGLLGNNLVRMLLARGQEVRVLARGAGRRELEGLDLSVEPGDLADGAALARCFAGAEVVVHAAAAADVRYGRAEEIRKINVEGTRAVCAAVPAGARLVHVSSVDGLAMRSWEQPADEACIPGPEPTGIPYVETKREADRVVRAAGVDHVLVHPTLLFGPWDWKPSSGRMILAIARGLGRFPPDGGNNFVHVRDVCEGILRAADAPIGSAWVLGGENLRYRDAWGRIAAIVGAPAPMATLPRWLGSLAAGGMELARALGLPEGGEVNAATTRMGFYPHYFDGSRARRELALPHTPWEDAVREAWDWFRERGYASAEEPVRH